MGKKTQLIIILLITFLSFNAFSQPAQVTNIRVECPKQPPGQYIIFLKEPVSIGGCNFSELQINAYNTTSAGIEIWPTLLKRNSLLGSDNPYILISPCNYNYICFTVKSK